MNLYDYIAPVIRWWWLLLVATLAAGISSYYATSQQPPLYQSRTTLMIGQSISNPNPSTNQFYLEEQLASIYADMGTREPVRKATMDALGLNWLPEYVVRALPDSQMIEITVTDTNPVRAQAIASELAKQLKEKTPTNSNSQDQDRRDFINKQLDQIQADITATQNEMESLKTQLGSMTSARQISETERQISALETKLASLNSNYTSLLASTDKGAVNTLEIIEAAEVPTRPISGNTLFTVLLSAAVGMVLAAGAAYIIEYFDQTIKTRKEVEKILDMPVLSEIPKIDEDAEKLTYVLSDPYSPFADAFRSLRVNLEIAGLGTTIKSLIITSPGVSDGKTTISSNLLFALTEAKKKVVLIDADFYRSPLEERLAKESGMDLKETGDYYVERYNYKAHVISLKRQLAHVHFGDKFPANPTELLNSPEFIEIFEHLRETCDIVIIDSPPFILSDAMVLSMQADAVLVVVKQNHTRRDMLQRMKEQMEQSQAKLLGFVLNSAQIKTSTYYGYYYRGLRPAKKKKKFALFQGKTNNRVEKRPVEGKTAGS